MSVSALNPSTILEAQNAYNTTSAQKAKLADPQIDAQMNIESTASFQKMVNKNFNSFAKMNPEQIMAVSKQVQNAGSTNVGSNAGIIAKMFSNIPQAIRKNEEVTKRAIINEASLTEVIAATSEAKAVLQTAVAVRNKVLDAFEKIMNMPI